MSDAKPQDPLRWDLPPFAIDEGPDPLYDEPVPPRVPEPDDAPDLSIESDQVLQEVLVLQEGLAGLQTIVERIGRELYKHTTRMDSLPAQVTRLRADVTSLMEAASSDDKVADTIKAMLPLLDGLSNLAAATHATAASVAGGPGADALAHLGQAVAIVQEKSAQVLKDLGVVPMDSLGKPFDGNRQVVVDTVNNPDLPPLVVVEEESSGYLYRDQVLRRAQVIVNKHLPKTFAREPIAPPPPTVAPPPPPAPPAPAPVILPKPETRPAAAPDLPRSRRSLRPLAVSRARLTRRRARVKPRRLRRSQARRQRARVYRRSL